MECSNESFYNYIISCVLATTKYQDCIFSQLEEKHFIDKKASVVYKTAKEIYLRGDLVDNVFVGLELQHNGQLTSTISEYIANNTLEYVSGANYQFYINKIKKLFIDRLVQDAKTEEDFNSIQKEVEENQTVTQVDHISKDSDKFLDRYYNQLEHTITFEWQALKDAIGTLAKGDYFFLSSVTGGGKSALALNLADSIAKQGKKVLYFNLEMTTEQMQNRLVCKRAGLDSSKYRKVSFESHEIEQYQHTLNKLEDLPMYIVRPLKTTPLEVKSYITQIKPDIVIIDYLGLMDADIPTRGDTERITYISRKLKNLALFFGVPFVVLHQLNRDYKDRSDKRPKLTDIKNSSQIEQDADFVSFLHTPSLFDDNEPKDLLEFINAKNRHGEANRITELKFDRSIQRIEDY